MEDWAEANQSMISRLSAAIHQKPKITADAIWDMVAGDYSPEWAHAKSTLKSAQQQLDYLHLPENKPLGLIGAALHSDEINSAKHAHHQALTHYTVVNEMLHQDNDLQRLMRAVKQYQQIISQSLDLSKNAASMTAAFANVSGFDMTEIAPEPSTSRGFFGKTKLAAAFKGTGKLRHRTSAALKGGQKKKTPQQGM